MLDHMSISTLAERPELAGDVQSLKQDWPAFMLHDLLGDRFYVDARQDYADYILVAHSAAPSGGVLACAYSVPVGLAEDPPAGLPNNGWDGALQRAHLTRLAGYEGDALCGLEVMVRHDLRAYRLGSAMLKALLALARDRGLGHFIAPVRPPGKARFPDMSIDEYARQTTPDGLPQDPLLRAHVRLGATIVGPARASMVVAASVERWREWTGLPFNQDGPVVVPEALAPVHCDVAQGHAVYVEPNVWVHTRLA